MSARVGLGALLLLLVAGPLRAQGPLFTDAFPTEEFSDRRARVMDQIGDAFRKHDAEEQGGIRLRIEKQGRSGHHLGQTATTVGVRERQTDQALLSQRVHLFLSALGKQNL